MILLWLNLCLSNFLISKLLYLATVFTLQETHIGWITHYVYVHPHGKPPNEWHQMPNPLPHQTMWRLGLNRMSMDVTSRIHLVQSLFLKYQVPIQCSFNYISDHLPTNKCIVSLNKWYCVIVTYGGAWLQATYFLSVNIQLSAERVNRHNNTRFIRFKDFGIAKCS